MKQITNVNDLQEGDVMVLGKSILYALGEVEKAPFEPETTYSFYDDDWLYGHHFFASEVQDLMDHGIPFRRKVADGGK